MVEYALLAALVAGVTILILSLLGVSVRDVYCAVAGPLGLDDVCAHYLDDSFDGDLSAWDVVKGKWSIEDGQLVGGPGESRIFAQEMDYDDYTITLDTATLKKGNGYGVYFRATGTPKFDGYSFQYDPGYKAFILRRWVKGKEERPFAIARAPDYPWWNVPRKVQVRVEGDTFTAYVDGEAVLTGVDDTYSEGTVGLRAWDGTEVEVDRLIVDPIR